MLLPLNDLAVKARSLIVCGRVPPFPRICSGNVSFSAQAKAVAITAGFSAASTSGSSAGASGGQRDSGNVGGFRRGMATFTVARGGLMYEASVGGTRFPFRPVGQDSGRLAS